MIQKGLKFTLFTALIAIFTCFSCLEWHPEVHKSTYGLKVHATDKALENDTSGYIDWFVLYVDLYQKRIFEQLNGYPEINSGFYDGSHGTLDNLIVLVLGDEVIQYGEYQARGYYDYPDMIVLALEDKMLSVFGHELIRFILWYSGHHEQALWTSEDWITGPGGLWNMAETTAYNLYIEMEGHYGLE